MNATEKLAADLAAAQAASAAMSARVTRTPARDYLISYRMVDEVDNQGGQCEHCEAATITCNVYAHIHRSSGNGTDVEVFECCETCALNNLDGEWDVATEFLVIIERATS